MKRIKALGIMMALIFIMSSFVFHKFYVGIFQVNYAPEKKMMQITSRIFIDDLNDALKLKYKRDFHLGEDRETAEDISQMEKYISENFTLIINGKSTPMQFLSKEMESNVLICYFRIPGIQQVKTMEVSNKILFDFVTEQQNIIQTTVYGKKNSLLLTTDKPSGTLKFKPQ